MIIPLLRRSLICYSICNILMLKHLLVVVKLVLYYLVYQLVFGIIGKGVSSVWECIDATTATSLAMMASIFAMAWHLMHFGYVRFAEDRYKELSLSVLCVSIVLIFSAIYVLNLLIEQAGIPNTLEDTFLAMSRNPFGILSIAIMGPILEEMLFRGALQGYLQAICGKTWVAIVISSLVFGVVHMNPAQMPFAFLLGILFGWLYYRTGSLLPGIVGHVLNNFVATVNMALYGNAPIEELIGSSTAMWVGTVVAAAICCLAAVWLDRKLPKAAEKVS